ncbi:MAG: DUF1801 domain-containing protein [Saprospiraceae bacterium]
MNIKPTNVDDYIALMPEQVQEILFEIRSIIHKSFPEVIERISYAIPCFTIKDKKGKSKSVFIAAFKNHIGLYPAPREIEEFKKDLALLKGGKGTEQFQLSEKIPYDLITRIIKFKLSSN